MAYKKYIKRGGKIYGPYIYHSRRIDGKVISEYRGPGKLDYKKIFLAVFGVIFLVALILILVFSEREITGRAVLDLNADYQKGKVLDGNLRLSLQEGELIPASSKLIFENNGNVFEYNLKDLVSEEPTEGNFYIKGASLSGSGEGYGIPGGKESSPIVYFVLSILSEEEPGTEQVSEPETTEIPQTENITQEEPAETPTPEVTEETPAPEEVTTQEPEPAETPVTEEQTQEAPITGNVISRFAGAISNFFLGLTMTGKAVIEFEREVEGQVSAGETFVYTLQEWERAELKPLSVRTDSEQLSDSDVVLRTENNELIVTTSYSETGQGFGEEYLGSKSKELVIDVSGLNLVLEQGDLRVSLSDSGQEIISLSTILQEGEVAGKTLPEPEPTPAPEIPESELANETEIYVPELVSSLTEQERTALIEEFGNASVEVKEYAPERGFIKVRFELGKYWAEFNYDANYSRETLDLFIEKNRKEWLKDIAKKLLEEPETRPEGEVNESEIPI